MAGKFDTIIIGGGLGGLTAGATLAKFGKKYYCSNSITFQVAVPLLSNLGIP
jgi:anaerobic glycerol-3-phosphate dehydrogenase